MIAILAVSLVALVVAVAVAVAAGRLTSVRVRRRRKLIAALTSAIADLGTRPQPFRAPYPAVMRRAFGVDASSNVKVLADYRKLRARHDGFAPSAQFGMPVASRSQRPEPA